MKIIKKFIILIILLITVSIGLSFAIGYSYYTKKIQETSLEQRIETIKNNKHFIPYEELSKDYINAVIAVEDHRFYEHGPVDFIGIARALYSNFRNREFKEGGSTITQQVSKNIIFNQDKTVIRKLGEFFGAYNLEKKYNKNEIFALYVNTSYFGEGYYGIYDASMGYYKKEPKDLTLDEATMLAGVPNAPSIYAPTVNPDLAKKRQAHVLSKMLQYKYITQDDISFK